MDTEILDMVKNMDKQVADFVAASNASAEEQSKLSKRHEDQMKVLNEQAEEINARILGIEQGVGAMGGGVERIKSLGEQFAESDSYKNWMAGNSQKASFEIVRASTTVGSDDVVAPDRMSEIVPGAFRNLRVADILPGGNTTSNAVEYTRESSVTNDAAETGEGDAKPESDIVFELISTPVRTIPTWLKVSTQVRDDAPMLISYINTRLAYMVDHRYDSQLLNGDGTGVTLSGLLANDTAFTPDGTDPVVSIRQAITQVELADYSATAVILNPTDVQDIELTTSTDGVYIISDPKMGRIPMIWGLPIVTTNAMTAGQFQVGAYNIAAQRWERQGTVVEAFEQDDVNVQSNLVTLRAERRAALAVYLPAALVGGALST